MNYRTALWLSLAVPLAAQLPPAWQHQERLGQGVEAGAWWGAGLWSGDGQGPPATLESSLGLGNALTGAGFHLEGGLRLGHLDVAAETLGVKGAGELAYLTLYRSHVWWHGASGWQGGFEQEPLVWGYGLHGGYLLGEAARPFPRLRVATPDRDLSLFKIPLGRWGFQAFMGRLENHRVLSSSIQDASYRTDAIESHGDPQAPLLGGYRLQARFGPRVELYLNYLNLWAGTLNGAAMTQGYGLKDYLTSMFGLKDTLAESNHDPAHPPEYAPYRNSARSGSEVDWGLRVESPALARPLGADHVWLSLSRGSKSMGWPLGVFLKNPPKYLGKDVEADVRNLTTGRFGFGYDYNARYALPSEIDPNDDVAVLVQWPRFRFGLEYLDTTDSVFQGHRTFAHGIYLTGFYYHGDPLGETLAGETRAVTARLEWDAARDLTLVTWVVRGIRPFRDAPDLWLADHPGAAPGADRIVGLQQSLRGRLSRAVALELGAAWERHGAVDYEAGREGNGFRWFTNLSCRFPGRD